MTFKHGGRAGGKTDKTYNVWMKMRERCLGRTSQKWELYGGRGIKICKRWDNFLNFLSDMGRQPAGMTLERKNNNKGYFPNNCKWATIKEQSNNRRSNHCLTFKGERKTMAQWAEYTGITPNAISHRICNGWTITRALTQPLRITK